MKKLKPYFVFTSAQRSGVFVLLALIVTFSFVSYYSSSIFQFFKNEKEENLDKEWISLQTKIDSIKRVKNQNKFEIKPFNPNFISDYKGDLLGMSPQELDRLFAFRKENKYVNSAKEFQDVTQVSDSLLAKIAPLFKFPDWVTAKKNKSTFKKHATTKKEFKPKKIVKLNINNASKVELMNVYGIGDKISDIILSDKEKFGTFVSIEQLQYVWGVHFNTATFENIKKHFFVQPDNSKIKKLHINEASMNEIKQFPYFNYYIAKDIVTYRSMNGQFTSVEDLTKIKGFPVEKLQIIALYLEL